MKLLIGIILLILVVAIKADDECTFVANVCRTVSQTRKCLDLFPLDSEFKEFTLGQLKKAYQIHPLTDVLPRVGVDIFKTLRKIGRKHYRNEFDFHKDLFHDIAQNTPDFSTTYSPPVGFSRIRVEKPFVLVPDGSTEHFKISAINPHYNLSADLIGKEVISVDGSSVVDYIASQFYFGNPKEQLFMYNYLYQRNPDRLVYRGVPSSDKITFTFADKTTLDVQYCVFTRLNVANFTEIQTLNLPAPPTPPAPPATPAPATPAPKKRSEGLETERCNSKTGICFDGPITFEGVHVGKRGNGPSIIQFENSTDGYVQRGIVENHGKKLPFLRLISFNRTDTTWKKVVVNFVKQLSKRRSPLAIIDLTEHNFGADICETEWLINVLSQTNTQPYQKDTYKSKNYRTLYDARVTNRLARFLFSNNFASIVDPTSGLPFEDSFCPAEKPIKLSRNKSKQLFSSKFYQSQCKDFIKPRKFPTKFLILTNTRCGGVCALFQSVMRKTGAAKIVGIGGVTGKPLSVNFAYYGGPSFDWNADVVPIFPLVDDVKPLGTSAVLDIPSVEAFLSDSKIPEAVFNLNADEIIGWDKYTFPVLVDFTTIPAPRIDLYVIASTIDPNVEKVELPVFNPKGKCYSEKAQH